MMRPVFRFAPSPNGALHLGHAYSALLNAKLARESGGRLLLRFEDIDTARCSIAFEDEIRRDLSWLGIVWEEPVRRQSDHFADYERALDALVDAGLAYPSFMSRGEARETCWEMTMPARLAKPGMLRRSGTLPACSITMPRRGSS